MSLLKSPTKFFLALFIGIFLLGSVLYAFVAIPLYSPILFLFFFLPALSGFFSVSMLNGKTTFEYLRAGVTSALAFAGIAPAPFTFLWGAWVMPYYAAARVADWLVAFIILGTLSLGGSIVALLLKRLPKMSPMGKASSTVQQGAK